MTLAHPSPPAYNHRLAASGRARTESAADSSQSRRWRGAAVMAVVIMQLMTIAPHASAEAATGTEDVVRPLGGAVTSSGLFLAVASSCPAGPQAPSCIPVQFFLFCPVGFVTLQPAAPIEINGTVVMRLALCTRVVLPTVDLDPLTAACIESQTVQGDAAAADLSIGDSFFSSTNGVTYLIASGGSSCDFACHGGFDVNCDGRLGDFCPVEFDIRSVRGVGECQAALAD